jgi:hypothetical protein
VTAVTPDERSQLLEDIKKSDTLRRGIVERAELSQQFDILAAWEEVEPLDESINDRIAAARGDSLEPLGERIGRET